MKKVELTHAEIINQYKKDFALSEFQVEKGTVIRFQIKTRINDRVENSPWIFETCSYFADSEDKLNQLRNIIKTGNIVEIKGTQDRQKYEDKVTGATKYSESVRIREITPVNVLAEEAPQTDEDLPF